MAMQHQYNDDQAGGLIIHIAPEQLRRRITKAAAQNDLSVQEYVGRILDQVVPPDTTSIQKQSGRINRAAGEELKKYREEIRRTHPDEVFEDSVELLRQDRLSPPERDRDNPV